MPSIQVTETKKDGISPLSEMILTTPGDNATIPFPAYVEREINASSRLLPPTNMQAAQESARRAHIRESVSRARAESESAVPSTIYDILEREFGPSSSNSGP